jgi:hypothetical protein
MLKAYRYRAECDEAGCTELLILAPEDGPELLQLKEFGWGYAVNGIEDINCWCAQHRRKK